MSKTITRVRRMDRPGLKFRGVFAVKQRGYYVNLSNYYTRTETDDIFRAFSFANFYGQRNIPRDWIMEINRICWDWN